MDLLFFGAGKITHSLLCTSALLALAVKCNLVKEQDIIFAPNRITNGELWRLPTGLFYVGKMDPEFFYLLLMHCSSFKWHESTYYHTKRAFAWRLILLAVASLLVASYWHLRFPGIIICIAFTYLAGRREAGGRAVIFNLSLPMGLFPFHNIFMAYIMGNFSMIKVYIAGAVLGHTVLWLDDIVPIVFGKAVLALPNEND